jgi:hypothetical protein
MHGHSKIAASRCLAKFFVVAAMLFCVSGLTGCQLINNICRKPPTTKPSIVLAQNSSLDDVINAVNNNNAKKLRFVATNARINIEGAPVSLKSNITYEYPKKYRATGETVVSKEFDIGSNEELFWVWFKQDPQKSIYFSRHDQYEASPMRDSFQINPDWLVEAMGMTIFQPTPREEHRLAMRTAEGHWKIETKRPTLAGTYTKLTTVDGQTACVLMQELYNPSGLLVASAVSPSHLVDPTTNITYPETVDMIVSMQGQQVGMRLSMGNVQFNPNGPFLGDLFLMPNYPDTRRVDISTQMGMPVVQQNFMGSPMPNP